MLFFLKVIFVRIHLQSFWNKQQLELDSWPADTLDSIILLNKDASVAPCFILYLDCSWFYLFMFYLEF